MAFCNSKIILILAQIVGFWSVWRWYFLRLSGSEDEAWGVLALVAIFILSYKNRSEKPIGSFLYLIIASILLFAVLYPFLPPLLRAVIAVTSLTFTISNWRFGKKFHFGIWSLFLLSLPIVPSLQFYFGFPMRIVIGEATAFLLKLNGLVVFREGVCLHFGEKLIWIDAPCSGIKMLWVGFFLASLLVSIYKLDLRKSVLAFAITFLIILTGNIFRATGLFYLEAEIIKMPSFAHEAIGASAFLITCIGIAATIMRIRTVSDSDLALRIDPPNNTNLASIVVVWLYSISCLLAFSIPFFTGGKELPRASQTIGQFPTTFDGKLLQQLDLTDREQFFANDFPGEVKRFSDGNREIIIRYVTTATRKLHSSSDCLSAIGYSIKPIPLTIDENKQKWSCFNAIKGSEKLKVCERIYTDSGESWTDVSSWYWSAISDGGGQGYWAVTIAETSN